MFFKTKPFLSTLSLFIILLLNSSWGFYAHKTIHEKAIYLLPEEMFWWFKENIDYIIEHAVDADKRRYSSELEAPRHYIDLDHFNSKDSLGIDRMPAKWNDAVAKFSEDSLKQFGILPWRIQQVLYYLTKAFEQNDANSILRNSVDLGHYLADAHVPLHTTENYNGQLSNQHGIHALWESRIPEKFASEYNFLLKKAVYIENPLEETWMIIKESHAELSNTLKQEKELTTQFLKQNQMKFAPSRRGNLLRNDYSDEFVESYNERLNGIVESRMQKAVYRLASFWLTAWVNAGQPNLSKLSSPKLLEDTLVKKIKIKGLRNHE